MTSAFPRRPRVLKGALVAYASALLGPVPNVIVFQYNPDTVTRTVRHRTRAPAGSEAGGRARAGEPIRVTGPPQESLSLTITLDATDKLEVADPLAVTVGVHPALAALELLLYPDSTQVLRNAALTQAGASAVPAAEVPSVLLVWGLGRVVPVSIESLAITERAYDPLLNPTLADVDVSLQVLTYLDLALGSVGHGASVAHHIAKEALARANVVDTAATAVAQAL